jgi:hypothetical protein
MVQYHDEPYALWRQFSGKGQFNVERLDSLLQTIKDWNLFLAFLIVDGCTAGKSREPLRWFIQEIQGKVASSFTDGGHSAGLRRVKKVGPRPKRACPTLLDRLSQNGGIRVPLARALARQCLRSKIKRHSHWRPKAAASGTPVTSTILK